MAERLNRSKDENLNILSFMGGRKWLWQGQKSHVEVSKGAAWTSLQLLMLLEVKLLFAHQHLLKKVTSQDPSWLLLRRKCLVSVCIQVYMGQLPAAQEYLTSVFKNTCCCVIFWVLSQCMEHLIWNKWKLGPQSLSCMHLRSARTGLCSPWWSLLATVFCLQHCNIRSIPLENLDLQWPNWLLTWSLNLNIWLSLAWSLVKAEFQPGFGSQTLMVMFNHKVALLKPN